MRHDLYYHSQSELDIRNRLIVVERVDNFSSSFRLDMGLKIMSILVLKPLAPLIYVGSYTRQNNVIGNDIIKSQQVRFKLTYDHYRDQVEHDQHALLCHHSLLHL